MDGGGRGHGEVRPRPALHSRLCFITPRQHDAPQAGTRETPLLVIDDEKFYTYDAVMELIENGTFDQIFNY